MLKDKDVHGRWGKLWVSFLISRKKLHEEGTLKISAENIIMMDSSEIVTLVQEK